METIANRENYPPRINAEFQLIFPQKVIAGSLDIPKTDRDHLSKYIRERESEFRKRSRDNVIFEESPIGFHNMPAFDVLFQRIGRLVNGSLFQMGLSPDHLDFYILRSWANCNTEGMTTAKHIHLNSHISIVYYPDNSCSQASLNFHGDNEQSWVPGYNTVPYERAGLHDATNPLSANFYSMVPREDLCLIFPSSMVHSVSVNTSRHPRISVAMDGLFTLKEYKKDEPLLPPPSTWRHI